MSTTNYLSIKHSNKAREVDEKKRADLQKGILILILDYLLQRGYNETVTKLEAESGVSLDKYSVADNIDLEFIVKEYQDFYQIKHEKQPKLFRRVANNTETQPISQLHNRKAISAERKANKQKTLRRIHSASNHSTQDAKKSQKEKQPEKVGEGNLDISGQKIVREQTKVEEEEDFFERRILKPIPMDMYPSDLRELALTIQRDIISQNPEVKFDDIVGLNTAKQLIKEAVVIPLKFPQFFTGLLSPWKGVLLFGPPGTGKTMLAKAVATECKTTFFNISASAIVSKWRGDSEKLVRILFELARFYAPSTIFLDELDSIMSQRDSSEHEGSRRMKTELLIQMDGLAKSNAHVFVLAASNLPWDLDVAVLRRLEKRVSNQLFVLIEKILVGLPNAEARKVMYKKFLGDRSNLTESDYEKLAELSKGYSGSDIHSVCKEAAMKPMRKLFSQLEHAIETKSDEELSKGIPLMFFDCLVENVKIEPVVMKDVIEALQCTKSSVKFQSDKYRKWMELFGSNTISVNSSMEL